MVGISTKNDQILGQIMGGKNHQSPSPAHAQGFNHHFSLLFLDRNKQPRFTQNYKKTFHKEK